MVKVPVVMKISIELLFQKVQITIGPFLKLISESVKADIYKLSKEITFLVQRKYYISISKF